MMALGTNFHRRSFITYMRCQATKVSMPKTSFLELITYLTHLPPINCHSAYHVANDP